MKAEKRPDLIDVEALLPSVVREMITLLGYPDTERLIEKFGGLTFRVGKGERLKDNRRRAVLVENLGEAVTQKIEGYFGGEDLYIPRCTHALKIWHKQQFIAEYDAMLLTGESARFTLLTLCPRYGVSDRWAQRAIAEQGLSKQQLDLL